MLFDIIKELIKFYHIDDEKKWYLINARGYSYEVFVRRVQSTDLKLSNSSS